MFCDNCQAETRCTCICDKHDFDTKKVLGLVNGRGYVYEGKSDGFHKLSNLNKKSTGVLYYYYKTQPCTICGDDYWYRKGSGSKAHAKCRSQNRRAYV